MSEDYDDLLMKFEQSKLELEILTNKVDSVVTMNQIHYTSDPLPGTREVLEMIDELAEAVAHLLSWKMHEVKRSIRAVQELKEEEENED